ncbi:MAG: hypothetical protein QOI69_1367, partial [Pseudonocardiales bacterium]|nr:hypothetical protein [Pseudonocardiales bacterium]
QDVRIEGPVLAAGYPITAGAVLHRLSEPHTSNLARATLAQYESH